MGEGWQSCDKGEMERQAGPEVRTLRGSPRNLSRVGVHPKVCVSRREGVGAEACVPLGLCVLLTKAEPNPGPLLSAWRRGQWKQEGEGRERRS